MTSSKGDLGAFCWQGQLRTAYISKAPNKYNPVDNLIGQSVYTYWI